MILVVSMDSQRLSQSSLGVPTCFVWQYAPANVHLLMQPRAASATSASPELSDACALQEFFIYAVFNLMTFSGACAAFSTCDDDPIVDNFHVCTGAHSARTACVRALGVLSRTRSPLPATLCFPLPQSTRLRPVSFFLVQRVGLLTRVLPACACGSHADSRAVAVGLSVGLQLANVQGMEERFGAPFLAARRPCPPTPAPCVRGRSSRSSSSASLPLLSFPPDSQWEGFPEPGMGMGMGMRLGLGSLGALRGYPSPLQDPPALIAGVLTCLSASSTFTASPTLPYLLGAGSIQGYRSHPPHAYPPGHILSVPAATQTY